MAWSASSSLCIRYTSICIRNRSNPNPYLYPRLSVLEFEKKCESRYNINNIYPYSIHLHDYWTALKIEGAFGSEIQFRVRALACVLALDSWPAFTWVGSTNDFSFCRGGRIRRGATLAVRSRGEAYFFFSFFFSLFDIILIWKIYCPKKVINIT